MVQLLRYPRLPSHLSEEEAEVNYNRQPRVTLCCLMMAHESLAIGEIWVPKMICTTGSCIEVCPDPSEGTKCIENVPSGTCGHLDTALPSHNHAMNCFPTSPPPAIWAQ